MQKSLFITVSVASLVSALVAGIALITKHPPLVQVFLTASGVLNGLLVWQFACKTKCDAQLEVEDMRKERDFDSVWRELDLLQNRINEVESKAPSRR